MKTFARNIAIILVSPQMGENIGAVARIMKNFEFSDLRIVSPRDGWPNEQAINVSVGAVDLIHRAKIYDNISTATQDLSWLYATTSAKRNMNKAIISSFDLARHVEGRGFIGIMFGRESSGLSNEEISLANEILTIPTNPNFDSLNLSQAVAVTCYSLFSSNVTLSNKNDEELIANRAEIELVYDYLFQNLSNTKFFKTQDHKIKMQQKIRHIFSKIDNLSKFELNTLRSIIKSLIKQ